MGVSFATRCAYSAIRDVYLAQGWGRLRSQPNINRKHIQNMRGKNDRSVNFYHRLKLNGQKFNRDVGGHGLQQEPRRPGAAGGRQPGTRRPVRIGGSGGQGPAEMPGAG